MFNSSPRPRPFPTKTMLTATKGGASGQVGPVRADNSTWWRARSQRETGQVLALPLSTHKASDKRLNFFPPQHYHLQKRGW